MRGATSPRLLLELMCAQVLLPAAATDEKSLLARLERLERGHGRRRCRRHPRARRTPVKTMMPNGPGCEPRRTAGARARPVARLRTSRLRSSQPRPGPAAPPASPGPASPGPATAQPRPGPAAPAQRAPAQAAPPERAAGSPGLSAADSLRKNWDAVLEAVKQERRVAWMLLSNASVLSLEDGILTLRFPQGRGPEGLQRERPRRRPQAGAERRVSA